MEKIFWWRSQRNQKALAGLSWCMYDQIKHGHSLMPAYLWLRLVALGTLLGPANFAKHVSSTAAKHWHGTGRSLLLGLLLFLLILCRRCCWLARGRSIPEGLWWREQVSLVLFVAEQRFGGFWGYGFLSGTGRHFCLAEISKERNTRIHTYMYTCILNTVCKGKSELFSCLPLIKH